MPMPTVLGPIQEALIGPGSRSRDDNDIAGFGPAKIVPGVEMIDNSHIQSSSSAMSMLNVIYAALILGAGLFVLARNAKLAKSIANNVSTFFHCGKNNRPNHHDEADQQTLIGQTLTARQY
jgi:hypothetical protein